MNNNGRVIVRRSASQTAGKFHEADHLAGDIFFCEHSEMMVELICARNLGDLLKTQIVGVRLLKREDHVNEVLSQVGDVCDAFSRRGYTYHRFGRMQGDAACLTELSDKMVE